MQKEKLSKRERRALRKTGQTHSAMTMVRVFPKTETQSDIFESYDSGDNLFLHGSAGTGKTFLSMYLSLQEVLDGHYSKVAIFRSIVPSRDIGFLPGSIRDKTRIYEMPYIDICAELFGREDAYDVLKMQGRIEFVSTSFVRGRTLSDTVFIIDECQNMTWAEINTVMTRVGDNCRVILCGDTKQSDLSERDGKSDIGKAMTVCRSLNNMQFIELGTEDIVRSGFVKEWLIRCEELKIG